MKVELELKNGKRRHYHPQVAKVLVARGLAWEVSGGGYQTRDMRAVAPVRVEVEEDAPYGYKADGTPRKRPGRRAAETEE